MLSAHSQAVVRHTRADHSMNLALCRHCGETLNTVLMLQKQKQTLSSLLIFEANR